MTSRIGGLVGAPKQASAQACRAPQTTSRRPLLAIDVDCLPLRAIRLSAPYSRVEIVDGDGIGQHVVVGVWPLLVEAFFRGEWIVGWLSTVRVEHGGTDC
jgi:hypothetical protein